MTRAKHLAVGAAAIGLGVGIGAAVAIPRSSQSAAASAAASVPVVATGPAVGAPFAPLSGSMKTGPARSGGGDVALRVHPGSMREELRRKDPAGGPDWVLRWFVADRVVEKAQRRHGVSPVIGSGRCVQLGREVDGRFGWIDGTNTFRPTSATSRSSTLTNCISSKIAQTHQPELTVDTLVGGGLDADATLRGSIVWGVVGRPIRTVSLNAAGITVTPALSKTLGAFLQFYGPGRSPADAELTTQYPTGKARTRGVLPPEVYEGEARMMRDMRAHAPKGQAAPDPRPVIPSTTVVSARASDPGGGPSWGLTVAKSTGGWWCTQATGALIGNRVGNIQPTLGLFEEQDFHGQPFGCTRPAFSAKTPIMLGSTFGLDPTQKLLDPARGKLRLQPGRTTFSGLVDPNADLVTITTPRDVRSVVPTGPAHAFIAVYDGDFGGGTVTFTVHMKDGTVRRMSQAAGI